MCHVITGYNGPTAFTVRCQNSKMEMGFFGFVN